jgi:uncharacterized protein YdeI (YjbR/CyaY-like superfamily)
MSTTATRIAEMLEKMPEMAEELPEVLIADAAGWRRWLRANHAKAPGAWVVLAKKGVAEPTSLTYAQALDEALCHGWIDGQVSRRDEATYRQRFTPRRPRSPWSANNVRNTGRLIAEGRMRAAGLAAIEAAKADGRWDAAYEGQASIELPADLREAIAAEPRAQAMFEILTSQNRYSLILRVGQAKRPETRARRIEQFVAMLARGETPHPQRRRLDAST